MYAWLLAFALGPQTAPAPVTPPVSAAPPALCAQIEALISAPEAAQAHWGVSVVSTDGTTICSVNAQKLFRPASTNKIFTSAAALALLGANHTSTTEVVADGTVANGTLRGDLRLIGGGDANFGTEDVPYIPPPVEPPNHPTPEPTALPPLATTIPDVEELADQIVKKGVRRVTGDVIGDDSRFAWQPYPPEWSSGDLLYGFGAPVSALSLHDNEAVIRVSRTPAASPSAPLRVEIAPAVPWFTVSNHATPGTSKGSCGSQLVIDRALGSRTITVAGTLPRRVHGIEHCGGTLAIEDPAEYAAAALMEALERRGVRIAGTARARHWLAEQPGGVFSGENDDDPFLQADLNSPAPQPFACTQVGAPSFAPQAKGGNVAKGEKMGAPSFAYSAKGGSGEPLAQHISPPLLADEVFTLKESQNLHAELLLRNLGVAYSCDRTERGSLHVVREFLLHAGVDPGDFVLYDGSGLSDHDLVTPRALTTFLTYATRQPWFAQWRAALPVSGVDGTLHKRFSKALLGRVIAKTGTLGESSALAGFVTTDAGTIRIFSIMVDNHTPMNSVHHDVVDAIVEAIATQGP